MFEIAMIVYNLSVCTL
uniref:Uncharacterized protein n=1 Tax=Rhizophora mucronata TaxID=61149 RepID=A0A2P2NIA8_RHIMU